MAEPKTAADQKLLSTTNRSVSIQLSNFSADILKNPQVYTKSGYCCGTPQPTVGKDITSTCSFVKTKGLPCGAVGVLSYDIIEDQKETADKRLAIMFSVPFDYTYFKNLFSLGVFDINKKINESLYEFMYYEKRDGFMRGKGTGSEIRYEGNGYTLTGTMSSGGNAEIKVELRNKKIK